VGFEVDFFELFELFEIIVLVEVVVLVVDGVVFLVVVTAVVLLVVVVLVLFAVVLFAAGNALSFTVIATAELFEGMLITYIPYPVPTKNAATTNINKDNLPLDRPELFVSVTGAVLGVVTYFFMRASFSSISSSSFFLSVQ